MPLASDMNINPLITGYSRRYKNTELIADRVLPPVKVRKTSGKYARYNKDGMRTGGLDLLSDAKDIAHSAGYNVDTDSFSLSLYRLSDLVDVLVQGDADAPFQPLQDTTENLMDLMGIDKEVKMADLVMGSGNYASGNKTALADSLYWTNYGTGTGAKGPVRQVHSAADVVRGKVMRMPTVMVVGSVSHVVLLAHPDIRDRLKFVQTITVANVTAALAAIFGVTEYFVSRSVKNTALEGESDSLSDVIADKAALIVRPTRPTVKSVSHSVQFQHRQFPNGDRWTVRERMGSTNIEVRDMYTHKSVDTSAGYLFDDTNA